MIATETQKLELLNEEDFEKSQGVTQSRYARMRSVTRQMISKYIKNDLLTEGRGILPNGRIDPEEANIELDEKLNPTFSNKGVSPYAPTKTGSFHDEKCKREKVQRKLLELELKKKSGEYINKKKADIAFSSKITAVVRRLQKISKRISPAVAKEGDRIKCENMIFNEIKEAVEEFGVVREKCEV